MPRLPFAPSDSQEDIYREYMLAYMGEGLPGTETGYSLDAIAMRNEPVSSTFRFRITNTCSGTLTDCGNSPKGTNTNWIKLLESRKATGSQRKVLDLTTAPLCTTLRANTVPTLRHLSRSCPIALCQIISSKKIKVTTNLEPISTGTAQNPTITVLC